MVKTLTKYFARGNLKLGNDTLIYNPGGAATDCVAARMGLCKVKRICYALKPERYHAREVLAYRRRQAALWQACTVRDFTDAVLRRAERVRVGRIDALRLSEAADFIMQADVVKAEAVAARLTAEAIVSYCYTARSDLDFTGCENLVVNGSDFMPEAPCANMFCARMNPTGIVCPGDCRRCNLCRKGRNLTISVKYH